MQEMQVQSMGQEDPLEKEMTTHSSVLAWESPWIEKLGRLQSQKSRTLLSYTITTKLSLKCIIVTPRRRQWHPTPVLLPGKSHGWRSLVGCSPWGREELDTTEWLHFHFSLLFIGEGNGCLENPRDGVAQSRTRLKWLSSSSTDIPGSSSELTGRGWTTFSPHFSNYLLFLFVLSLLEFYSLKSGRSCQWRENEVQRQHQRVA